MSKVSSDELTDSFGVGFMQGSVPGVLVDALDGRGTSGDPVHQIRVTVGEYRFSGEPVGVHKQPRVSQSVAASLVWQSAAVAQGPREGPHT